MKFIVPKKIMLEVRGSNEKKPISFAEFVSFLLNNDKRANDTGRNIRAAMRVEQLVKQAKEGAELELAGEDAALLKAIMEEPEKGYPIVLCNGLEQHVARQLLPFIEALNPDAEIAHRTLRKRTA